MSRQVTLLCPGLDGPPPRNGNTGAARAVLTEGLELAGLKMLRARGRVTATNHSSHNIGAERLLFRAFGWGDAMPAGPVGYAADFSARVVGYVMRVDPVSLQADASDLHLVDAAPRGITEADASALVDTLNAHFAGDPGRLVMGAPDRWYLMRETALGLSQRPPSEALGVPLSQCRATGDGARAIGSFMNEAQMLLYQHRVNEQRASLALAPVNTPWAWGGGVAAPAPSTDIDLLCSGGATGAALASAAGVDHLAEPTRWSDDIPRAGHTVVALDFLDAPARTMDIDSWRTAVKALDEHWLQPLIESLRNGRINALDVHGGNGSLNLTRMRLRQFWKR